MAKEKTVTQNVDEEVKKPDTEQEETVTVNKKELETILDRLSKLEERKNEQGDTQRVSSEKAEANRKKLTEKVKRRLFYDGSEKYKDDVFVCVNGKNMLIKRGTDVEIPVAFAEVLDNAAIQTRKAADVEEELSKDANWTNL